MRHEGNKTSTLGRSLLHEGWTREMVASDFSSATTERISIVSAGAYGKSVARHLKRSFRTVEIEWEKVDRLDLLGETASDIYVLAAWRPIPSACEIIDDIAHHFARPFLPLVLDSNILRFGPVVIPGRSGCWHCWQMRARQHSQFPIEQMVRQEFYEENPDIGPAGFYEPFAFVGAAHIGRVIRSQGYRESHAGYIWQLDMFTKEVSTGILWGVDGCSRCGLKRSPESRTYSSLRSELCFLWNKEERTNNV